MEKIQSNQYKGDHFERLVFQKLQDLIEEEKVPGVSKYYQVFFHKEYPSKTAPEFMLNPDITIEVYSNSEKKSWSNLIVVECKNRKRKIDHTVYCEFVGNLEDYPRSGVRGILVSSVGFTREVVTLAKKDNIALAILKEESIWEPIIWRKINSLEEIQFEHKVLLGEASTKNPVVYWGNSFITIADLLHIYGVQTSHALIVPFMNENRICNIVKDILNATNSNYQIGTSFINNCFLQIAPNYKLDFVELQEDCLGICDFNSKVITINSTLIEGRKNFTIAHELGHIVLHSSITQHLYSIEDRERVANMTIDKFMYDRMEYQANLFASFLLMPKPQFEYEVAMIFYKYRITRGRLYYDNQPCNIKNYNLVIGELSKKFNVSKEAVVVRMKRENLYEDASRCRSLGESLRYNI